MEWETTRQNVQPQTKTTPCYCVDYLLKVAYYSFPKKKIKVLEFVKLKQQKVFSEVLVTAIDVKFNFTEQINANQGKMLNIHVQL